MLKKGNIFFNLLGKDGREFTLFSGRPRYGPMCCYIREEKLKKETVYLEAKKLLPVCWVFVWWDFGS